MVAADAMSRGRWKRRTTRSGSVGIRLATVPPDDPPEEAGMAFREFTDSRGVTWRAWDVTTEQLHPATRGEDFMGNLSDGWLAFESTGERRRMPAPYPSGWTDLSIPAL